MRRIRIPLILLVLVVAALGVAVAAPAAQSSGQGRSTAQVAKKCKKKHQGKKKARKGCKKTAPPTTPTTVTPPAVSPPSCADDNLEPNDSIDQATPFLPPFLIPGVEAAICSPDSDFFAITTPIDVGGIPLVVIQTLTPFAPWAKLYDSEGNPLAWSSSSTTYNAGGVSSFWGFLPNTSQPGHYYVEVLGAYGSNGRYTFTLEGYCGFC